MYGLICPVCNKPSEHIMGANDVSMEVKCPCCARPLTRELHRDWPGDGRTIRISGDTCAGCFNHAGYDETLGVEVRSKQHREALMAEKGLVEYSPSTLQKSLSEDIRHIKKNSVPNDPQAKLALHKVGKSAAKKRQSMGMDEATRKADRKIQAALGEARAKIGA